MASEQGPVVTEASLQPSQHAPETAELPQPSITEATESDTIANPLKRARDDSPHSPTPVSDEPSYKAARFDIRSTSPIQLTAAAAALEAERRRREEDLGHDHNSTGDVTAHSVLEKLIQSAEALGQPVSSEPPAPQVTESPTPMDIDPKLEEVHAAQQQQQQQQQQQHDIRAPPTSLSYPGPQHIPSPMPAPPSRTLSYPLTAPSDQGSPTSPEAGSKRHKCPFCDTVFTRHHNLKSHLLTHSQEKPYECDKCKMRFRRLHDLKRHSKLHTGEKPHICPKCDRKFARGDALARHSKGAGGCAGRRSSMGSFAEDDLANSSMMDGDESQLNAALYTKYATEAEEARRRQSLPVPKASLGSGGQASPEGGRSFSSGHSRSNSGLYPPATERSSQQQQQQQPQAYTRRDSDRRTPPASSAGLGKVNSTPDGRYATSQNGQGTPQPGSARASNGTQAIDNSNMFAGDVYGLWTYIQNLEERFSEMEKADRDKQAQITALSTEVAALRKELEARPVAELAVTKQ
ncbi:unnamed protein product [Parascedosporium putredinis]|uniref:C2H2-type domain-containing protein n=1 Tax=Parascedosporium putredinis TaxID=1442378 RepID=A0A9P1H6U3_9PEZI|nr:unnamed protein product [Parascedosporium putredinis]CAI7998006.1 unnamed protein product [Parascedosporium putredinis]